MKNKGRLILNYLLFLALNLVLLGVQCSLWVQFFGSFPPAHFWLPTLVFWALYRDLKEGTIMCYLLTILSSSLTSLPLGIFLLINFALFLLCAVFKSKFYQPGSIYFAIICGSAAVLFLPIHFILSFIFESNPIQTFEFFQWLIRSLFTPLFAIMIYPVFVLIDDYTDKVLPTETGRQFG